MLSTVVVWGEIPGTKLTIEKVGHFFKTKIAKIFNQSDKRKFQSSLSALIPILRRFRFFLRFRLQAT